MAAPSTWEVVRDCHHFYRDEDCHKGHFYERDGQRYFVGEIGPYRWRATALMDVAHCSSCDKPIPTNGFCGGCEIIHADVAADGSLVEVEHIAPGRVAA